MAHGDYTVIAETKPEETGNYIAKPSQFVFDNDQSAKYGQLVTVRVKADPEDDTRLCVTEIEGIPLDEEDSKDNAADEAAEGE